MKHKVGNGNQLHGQDSELISNSNYAKKLNKINYPSHRGGFFYIFFSSLVVRANPMLSISQIFFGSKSYCLKLQTFLFGFWDKEKKLAFGNN